MNEGEKKAIEITRTLIEFAGDTYIPKRNREKLQILLNLIEKQQKEIENFKWKENEQKNLLRYKTDRIEEQQKEIDKQNKVIDEMAYCIDNYQICEYEIQDSRDRKCEYISDDENPPCKDCIKEYFIRKVEEDVQ